MTATLPATNAPGMTGTIGTSQPIGTIGRLQVRDVARAAVIAWTIVASVLIAVARRPFRPQIGTTAAVAADGLIGAFLRLGPTFVKVGQIIASAPSVFPETLSRAAACCLDEVAPFDGTTAAGVVEADLGAPVEKLFSSFDQRPLAAASIAQVHACTLADGSAAVIKVQRPGIAATMHSDLRVLHALARVAARTQRGREANAVAIVEDLHRVTSQELDFRSEAARQDRFLANLHAGGANTTVTAPRVISERCGPRVLCMERMSGQPLDAIAGRSAEDLELILRRTMKAWFESVILHGLYHGDVHGGNLWYLDDGRVAFLDFGIMGDLDAGWAAAIGDLLRAAALGESFAAFAASLRAVGAIPSTSATDEELGAQLASVLGPLTGAASIADISFAQALTTTIDLFASNGAPIPREMVLLAKQLLYLEGWAKRLAPGLNFGADPYNLIDIYPDAVARYQRTHGITLPCEQAPR